jgi:hypothetical protein
LRPGARNDEAAKCGGAQTCSIPRCRAERGISAVAAMANIWMPSAPGRTTWSVNGAAFQGEFGAGFSVAHRLPTGIPIAVTAGYGNGGGSAHVGRVGLMGEF